ncbi:class IV lanthionine synthetase LanL [Streptomyces sp. NPDC059002]|uniref:class IV lanthionine synthetase LanL n=1 Tax=Streptomyces sp. NPDC059002 TaxID=3346690 RepID=UPI003694C268
MTVGYREITMGALLKEGVTGWTLRDGETWCMVTPPDHPRREQGWKLHVSATRPSAPHVLQRAARVLVTHACAFKFAASPKITAELNSVRAPRAQSGKFLTVYPRDDEHLRTLARLLHEATLGLAGPAILSDRRYQPDSLVHYRYGSFTSAPVLTDEGLYESQLRAPDGTFVTDQRNPWFSPPAWALPPFEPPTPQPAASGRRRGDPVLLAGRYRIVEAIRHSNRGGVYRAHDQHLDEDVLIKEARPHVGADSHGHDAQHWLRHEHTVLKRLAPHGITPAARDVFEAGSHLFLVQDLIPGTSLARWCAERHTRDACPIPTPVAWNVARELTRLIGTAHDAGVVLRDVKPGNVMMTPQNQPVLIDMECTADFGEKTPLRGTAGFTAPEYLDQPTPHEDSTPPPVPGPEADCYSLGATLLHVTSGIIPVLAADSPAGRGAGQRIAALVDTAAPTSPALHALTPLILGLTADLPARWTLEEAATFLRRQPPTAAGTTTAEPRPTPAYPPVPHPTSAPAHPAPTLARPTLERLINDGLAHLTATIDPTGDDLWPRPSATPRADPCSLQLGAAGVLAVLNRAVRHGRHTAQPTLRTAATWLDKRLAEPGRILPGLYFGRSGTAWALHDAALTLDDTELADRTHQYALHIPLDTTNPDICHGLAGAGLTQLHLWHTTGDPRFAQRASQCADNLLHLTTNTPHPPAGPPRQTDEPTGTTLYGFGHGLAGTATFLLAAGRDLHRTDLIHAATTAGHTLCTAARTRGDRADWPKGPGQPERTDLNFWCHGASGVGTFLIRLWHTTGERRFRTYAERAAHAAHHDRSRLGPSTCHGAAGNAELLLDIADTTGDDHYRDQAAQTAACLHARATLRKNRLLIPDDTLREVCAAYNVGLAGVLDFLLRLTHGGNRSWLVDIP